VVNSFLLTLLLGYFGIHRFYLGRVGTGILMLVYPLEVLVYGIYIDLILVFRRLKDG
jgi:TM2 domain-containing membrane protein YozV